MRIFSVLALASLLVLAVPGAAQASTVDTPGGLAICTLDLGTVMVGPAAIKLPAVSYPCP